MSRQHQNSINNLSKQLPPIHEKTVDINAEECQSEELMDEMENRATLELVKSPSDDLREEAKERIVTDEQAENSQRALNHQFGQNSVAMD